MMVLWVNVNCASVIVCSPFYLFKSNSHVTRSIVSGDLRSVRSTNQRLEVAVMTTSGLGRSYMRLGGD